MRQYVIDELRIEDIEKIKAYLDKNYSISEMTGVYWIPVDSDILTEIQVLHTDCQPYYFAVELESDKISCELLVRTKKKINCSCMVYATREQRDRIIQLIDTIFEKNKIIF